MFLLFGKCISSTQLYWAVVLQGRQLCLPVTVVRQLMFSAAALRQGICTGRNEFLEAVSPFFRNLCLSTPVPLQSLSKAFCETLQWLPAQVLVKQKCKTQPWVVRLGQGSTREFLPHTTCSAPQPDLSQEKSWCFVSCETQTLCFYLMASEELLIRTRRVEEGSCVWEEAGSAAGCCVGDKVHWNWSVIMNDRL